MAGLALSSIINTLARVTVDRCVKVVESREKREESTEYRVETDRLERAVLRFELRRLFFCVCAWNMNVRENTWI